MIFIRPHQLETFGYRITSSARASIGCAIVSPNILEALRLTTSSIRVGCRRTGSRRYLSPVSVTSTCS